VAAVELGDRGDDRRTAASDAPAAVARRRPIETRRARRSSRAVAPAFEHA
jgi:hypothetical protein